MVVAIDVYKISRDRFHKDNHKEVTFGKICSQQFFFMMESVDFLITKIVQ